mmetsp:Transcript_16074/g.24951  ORF Transcript_16074/g.24951 Transcript_16074/m.24951 type:complete len:86 (+) Transcript_16074:394-651(+)|eukprot:CAMPEP_0184289500 /NCGR_PEP_ID=MMETSP1049-20130417/1964_1 /TAXON_ID=77928 /ORGANISM="Proteomonas sulcata, Strain CCMP704" /LENGTH=85 /DNA_ID=CAMNT_0026596349 /DNA_START=660 /DNA_END=917 /DNA_ORIENTATION=-
MCFRWEWGSKLRAPEVGDLVVLGEAGLAHARAVMWIRDFAQFKKLWPYVSRIVGCDWDTALSLVDEQSLDRGEGYLLIPEFVTVN